MRPSVDVVIPFAGPVAELERTCARASELALGPEDRAIVVDNRPAGAPEAGTVPEPIRIVRASDLQTPAHARNRGAATGEAEWLLFVDADVEWPSDLAERYFERPPGERTAILAGDLRDGGGDSLAARFARETAFMSQSRTLERRATPFAQTANCAVRRAAFEAVGGFADEARAAEDADLSIRLASAGWELERRPEAVAVHRPRETVRALLRQCAIHGAGLRWLDARHPGAAPRRRLAGLAWWSLRREAGGLAALARGDRDGAVAALIEPLAVWAYELGRLRPNVGQPG
jgi:GT2 family glycosyltransferase